MDQFPLALGIIPARGGSKGVPRKNIRSLAGRPLIAYTVDAAHDSQLLSRFLISTDDPEIAEIGETLGSEVLMRPTELAADDTPMVPVVQHALAATGFQWRYVVVLQPTTPLRTGEDIDHALELLNNTGADTVISVYQVSDAHPTRMYRLESNRLVPYAKEPTARLRQVLPPVFHRNGMIYASRTALVVEENTIIGSDLRPYIVPRERSINIDEMLDFHFAEFLLRRTGDIDE